MKKFLIVALLVLGITHVASLASVQALDAEPGSRAGSGNAYQLVQEDRRVDSDPEPSTGPQRRPAGTITGAYEANPDFHTYRDRSPYSSLSTKTQAVDHNCPCGPDCKCPDPLICKGGHCKKNYVIFFTTDFCKPCRTMYPRIEQLRKEGYIVYAFDLKQFKGAAEALKIEAAPTTVVIENGKELERFVGVVPIDDIKALAKTADEQKKNDPFDYDFR